MQQTVRTRTGPVRDAPGNMPCPVTTSQRLARVLRRFLCLFGEHRWHPLVDNYDSGDGLWFHQYTAGWECRDCGKLIGRNPNDGS